MRILENTRLVKNMNGTYSLYNNLIDRHLVVTSRGARSIVRFQNRHPIFDKSFFDDLKKRVLLRLQITNQMLLFVKTHIIHIC